MKEEMKPLWLMFNHYKANLEAKRAEQQKNELIKPESKLDTKAAPVKADAKADVKVVKPDQQETSKPEPKKSPKLESKKSIKSKVEFEQKPEPPLPKRNTKVKAAIDSGPLSPTPAPSGFTGFNFSSPKTIGKALTTSSKVVIQTQQPATEPLKGKVGSFTQNLASPPATASTPNLAKNFDLEYSTVRVYGNMLPNREKESYKTFRFKVRDNCFAVIPEVLAKYKIKEEGSITNYALFLCNRSQGNFN
jgi:hypothetical protein